MGRDTMSMPLHDYQAAIHHFNRAHGDGGAEPAGELSEDDFDEMLIGLAGRGGGIH